MKVFIPLIIHMVAIHLTIFIKYLQHSPLNDHHIKRICLIKTLLVKELYGKNLAKEKVQYSYTSLSCS